jgi:hypothetical protein
VADRIAFWTRLHERLARLANRLDAEAQAKVLGAVHERIPMVTLAEQCALQLENANADLRFWNGLAGMHAETIERHKALTVTAERKIADSKPNAPRSPRRQRKPEIGSPALNAARTCKVVVSASQ